MPAGVLSFFGFFYLVVNLGSLVGITVIVYVEENVGWAWGFGLTGEIFVLLITGHLVTALDGTICQ